MSMRLQAYLYQAMWFAPFRLILSWLYLLIIAIRNAFFDCGILKTTDIQTPVISVGNISVGGSGKTVLIEALVKTFLEHQKQPVVLSRGYGRRSKGLVLVANKDRVLVTPEVGGDEPVMIARNHPGVPVVVCADRIMGARFIETNFRPDVILLDDGFQHRKLHRDVNILILDTPDLREEHMLPRGRLREPASAIGRANVVLYSKSANQPHSDANLHFEVSSHLLNARGISTPLDTLQKPIGLFAGIGNPQYFFDSLTMIIPSIQTTFSFPDHMSYTDLDYELIANQNCTSWITTQKDMIKLDPDFCVQNNVYASVVKTDLPPILSDALKHYFK